MRIIRLACYAIFAYSTFLMPPRTSPSASPVTVAAFEMQPIMINAASTTFSLLIANKVFIPEKEQRILVATIIATSVANTAVISISSPAASLSSPAKSKKIELKSIPPEQAHQAQQAHQAKNNEKFRTTRRRLGRGDEFLP